MGVDLLEDGLYAMQDKLKDPAFEDKMVRFVRASMKGWKYATKIRMRLPTSWSRTAARMRTIRSA
jgi:hypothetical protein